MLLLQSFSLRYFVVVAVFASPAVAVVAGYAFAGWPCLSGSAFFAVVASPAFAVAGGLLVGVSTSLIIAVAACPFIVVAEVSVVTSKLRHL